MTLRYLASLVLPLLLLSGEQVRAQVKSPSPVEERANDVKNLIRAQPAGLESYFSKEFLSHIPAEQLSAGLADSYSNLGSPVRIEVVTLKGPLQGSFNFLFGKGVRLPVDISVDAAEPHLITKLFMGEPVSLSEREMTFAGFGGLTLHGTLLLPVGAKAKVPGVLLLPGSGQPDRDGNVLPVFVTDLLKQVAERLAKEGYASFRFDKRATAGYAKSWPTDVAHQNDFFSWDSFVGDAKAGLALLQAQPEVDGKRVVVAGHSEGATIAMQIGHDLQGTASGPAGLILISSPGRTGGVILREQITMNLKRQGVPADKARIYSDYSDLAINQLEKDGTIPPNPPPGLGLEYLFPASAAKLMSVEFGFDPAKVLPVYGGPVLVLQAEKDIQISAARDTPLIEAALKHRKSGTYELFMVPSASHNLKKVDNENVDLGVTGPVAPEALDKIAAWMRRTFPL